MLDRGRSLSGLSPGSSHAGLYIEGSRPLQGAWLMNPGTLFGALVVLRPRLNEDSPGWEFMLSAAVQAAAGRRLGSVA